MDDNLKNGDVSPDCVRHFNSVKDTLYILEGKWSIKVLGCLATGKKRFLELQRMVEGIGPKMLSKELGKLEINGLVNRQTINSKPLSVAYELTEYGESLKPLIDTMGAWGKQHRENIIADTKEKKH